MKSQQTKKTSRQVTCRFRKGLNQVWDWKSTLKNNFGSLAVEIRKATKPGAQLPEDFLENDESRRHYIVIVGRRKHYEMNAKKTVNCRII